MSFGEKLKRARKAKNLTQAEVAARLNKDFTSVSKWENNKAEPDRETIKKLAELYEMSLIELIDDELTTEELQFIEDTHTMSLEQLLYKYDFGIDITEDEILEAIAFIKAKRMIAKK